MDSKGKETQYFRTAKEAYENMVKGKLSIDEAWPAAAFKHINSEESQKKLCPKNTFMGLCESGDLKGINMSKQSDSINYHYAKFAIGEWKTDPSITKADMWQKVVNKFGKAKGHQGQLDVALALKEFWK